jgi:hypothetical protein
MVFNASYQDIKSIFEDLQEKNPRTLGDYSRRLHDYSRSVGVPSNLWMIEVLLRTSGL